VSRESAMHIIEAEETPGIINTIATSLAAGLKQNPYRRLQPPGLYDIPLLIRLQREGRL